MIPFEGNEGAEYAGVNGDDDKYELKPLQKKWPVPLSGNDHESKMDNFFMLLKTNLARHDINLCIY
jgi:hypothetical protein